MPETDGLRREEFSAGPQPSAGQNTHAQRSPTARKGPLHAKEDRSPEFTRGQKGVVLPPATGVEENLQKTTASEADTIGLKIVLSPSNNM